MTSSDGDQIWVEGYTTSGGVRVDGHWRARTSTRRAGSPDGGGQDGATESGAAVATAEPPHHGTTYDSDRGGDRASSVPSQPSVAREAKVAAGVQALRRRREQQLRESRLETAEQAGGQQDSDVGDDATREAERAAAGGQRCPDCGQYAGPAHTCPTPARLPEGDYSGLKKDERVAAMVGDLETSVQAVMESGQLERWLEAMSSNGLQRWSANNRLLATVQMMQRGGDIDGLHLMGFRQWEGHDRRVVKGAKAVWILAPMTRKVVEEDEDGNERERRRVVGFKGVPVFNVSDTEGEPLPGPPLAPAPGEATPGTLEGLRGRVTAAGYAYEETEIPGCRPATAEGTLGYTNPATKQIVVDARLSDAQKASTIAHELGHVHCGHVDGDYSEYQKHRGRMETEAEMCAYLTNRSRGMSREHADSFSPAYIAAWSKGDPAVMHTAVEKAVSASSKILDGDWPAS